MEIVLTGFVDENDYLDKAITVFCSGYHDDGMHVGVAISAQHSNVYAVYGNKPHPEAHFCTPQHAGCATFSFFKAYELLASRLSPAGRLTVCGSNYGARTLINRWKRGKMEPPKGYDPEGKELDEVAKLTYWQASQITSRYMSTRDFRDARRLLELREATLAALSTV